MRNCLSLPWIAKRIFSLLLFSWLTAWQGLSCAQPRGDGSSPFLITATHLSEGALLALFFLSLSIALPLCLFLTNLRDSRYLPLGATALAAGIYIVASSGLGVSLLSTSVLWPYLALCFLFLLPPAFCLYPVQAFPAESALFHLSFWQKTHLLFALAALIGVAANLFTAITALKLFLVLTMITFSTLFLLLIRVIRTGRRDAEIVLAGLAAFLLISLAGPVSEAVSVTLPLSYLPAWGGLLLLLSILFSLKLSPSLPEKTTKPASGADAGFSAYYAPTTHLSPPVKKGASWQIEVAGFAHDVNTPLGTGILAASRLTEEINELYTLFSTGELKKSELEKYLLSYKESAEIIAANLQTAADVVRAFREEAAANGRQSKVYFNINTCLQSVLTGLKPRIKQSGHELTFTCPEELSVSGYPAALSQIVTNLIMNSLIHAYPSGKRGHLTLAVTATPGMITIKYTDDGQGIAGDLLDKIFEPYATTNSSPANTGLGLFVVHSLVTRRLGGTIECDSVPGQYTCFLIKIPTERS
ncbi:7tm diverse intracellular signalling [Lucifera butyrica]|uniref:histidine kinase n=1 Tax=Lucifera butyrica TaxID=1351585 RepID=A0A498RD00_9FIRM|nr:sensor histidine kinase [Lucifera butyrica]VBB07048.1 7tm diverse intracellular signalling [Lucifera butyrica]